MKMMLAGVVLVILLGLVAHVTRYEPIGLDTHAREGYTTYVYTWDRWTRRVCVHFTDYIMAPQGRVFVDTKTAGKTIMRVRCWEH